MKSVLIPITVVSLTALAWLGARLGEPAPEPPHPAGQFDPPTTTVLDGAEVFQRAFWRRPGPTDKIHHAERRQWADETGITRWQWFLSVTPSRALLRHLFEDNAFQLLRIDATASLPPGAPSWFPQDIHNFEVHQSGDAGMSLFYDPKNARLCATSTGSGFTSAARAPATPEPSAKTIPPRRLPSTPPPDPRNP